MKPGGSQPIRFVIGTKGMVRHCAWLTVVPLILLVSAAHVYPDSGGPAALSPQAQWTLAFYLAGDNSLEREQVQNLREIIKGAAHLPHVNIVVFLDRDEHSERENPLTAWRGTRIFKVAVPYANVLATPLTAELPPSIDALRFEQLIMGRLHDPQERRRVEAAYQLSGSRYVLGEISADHREAVAELLSDRVDYLLPIQGWKQINLNAASERTQRQFVCFVGDHFPARHYALFVSGHGGGWHERDPEAPPAPDRTVSAEFHQTLKSSTLAAAARWHHFDVIALDSCLMGDMETLWNLKTAADYLVLNQNQIPSWGLNYTLLLQRLGRQSGTDPRQLATEVVSAYEAGYKDSAYPIVTAAFETAQVTAFARKWHEFFGAAENQLKLAAAISNLPLIPSTTATRGTMVDVLQLCRAIGQKELEGALIGSPGIRVHSFSHKSTGQGLSVYLPKDLAAFDRTIGHYRETNWARDFPQGWLQAVSRLYSGK
jgi:hypothetical protein